MNTPRGAETSSSAEAVRTAGPDTRSGRALIAALLVGAHMALGFAFGLSADAYLVVGIAITVAFQALVVRRPLRELWLRDGRAMAFRRRAIAAIAIIAIAPASVALRGIQNGDPIAIAYGVAGMVGAAGAVYALQAMDRDAVRATLRATLIAGPILVGVMVVYRLATGGFHGRVDAAVLTGVVSWATYLPAVFVMEEVFFRGLLDPYLQGRAPVGDRATALYGSALWGIWHLPVAFVGLGVFTIPYLVGIHAAIGYPLVVSWRRTGNLAVPGVAHATIDALRNAVAVL